MERDLFGEIPEYKNEVVKIAGEAAKKRRPKDIQRRINGPVENHRGYAVYKDFKTYFDKKAEEGQWEYYDWSSGRLRIQIKEILREAGWRHVPKTHRETRFYEPRWEAVE